MIQIIIVNMDDIKRKQLMTQLSRINTKVDIEIDYFPSHSNELEYCMRHANAAIIFLDPNYLSNDKNGVFIAKRLKIFNHNSLFIHISEDDTILYEVANSEPFAYIRKSEIETKLSDVLSRAIAIFSKTDETFYFAKRGESFSIPYNKIFYFCSDHRIINILCQDKSKEQFYAKMDEVEQQIVKDTKSFVRISQSYLVNIRYVLTATRNEVVMMNGTKIAITRKYKDNVSFIMKELES